MSDPSTKPGGRSVRLAGKRRMSREMALQMLYQADLGESPAGALFTQFDLLEYLAQQIEPDEEGQEKPLRVAPERLAEAKRAFEHACTLVAGTLQRLEEIDARLRSQAEHWRLERMPPVDRNILRLAAYELLADLEVPPLVVVDEAVELAKRFGSEQSGRFVNGMLDGLLRAEGVRRS